MKLSNCYSAIISGDNLPKKILQDTVDCYRSAVDYFIVIIDKYWGVLFTKEMSQEDLIKTAESLCIPSSKRIGPNYNFPSAAPSFNHFPSYLRRAAICAAFGKVTAYHTLLSKWICAPHKKGENPPGKPKAGDCFPPLYRHNMFEGHKFAGYLQSQSQTNGQSTIPAATLEQFCKARIKVFLGDKKNPKKQEWDWIDVTLRKSDIKYILQHCAGQDESVPTLINKGKLWKLSFLFTQEVTLHDKDVADQIVVSCDLGLNNAVTCSVMKADGTVLGREFLKLPSEEAHLRHTLGLIRKGQSKGNRKQRKLWSRARGINNDISVKTATFIIDVAIRYHADVIVMENLHLQGKKRRGGKRQRLSLWKAKDVQRMVESKAHLHGMRFSTVCAWNTSRLAFDGSGRVLRDRDNYSMCTFPNPNYVEPPKGKEARVSTDSSKEANTSNGQASSDAKVSAKTVVTRSVKASKARSKVQNLAKYEGGKRYHCDLSASYNIGARYFIRAILKAQDALTGRHLKAKVPECAHGSTCCLNTLISLNAELRSLKNKALA